MNRPNSQLGTLFNSKLSADSRNKLLDKLVGPRERIMNQVGNFVDKKMKEIKEDGFMQQRMGRLQEKLIQKSFLEGTPRDYEQKIDTLKKEIEWAKEEIANYSPRPPRGTSTETLSIGGVSVPVSPGAYIPSGVPDGYLDKVKKMLGEKEMELEFVEKQYRQKFPVDNPLILKQ